MKKTILILLASAAVGCATAPRYTDYVNPLLGTETLWDPAEAGYVPTHRAWGAEVFPGSSLPNALVQVSPVTLFRAGAGYQYEDSLIYGFSHTNKGHWNLNHVPILPIAGEVSIDDYASTFDHANEQARPAYYRVLLDRFGIDAELTSTLRAACHRYTFRKGGDRRVLVNLPRSNEHVRRWGIEQQSPTSFSGFQNTGQTVYFYAEANAPIRRIDSIRTHKGGAIYDDPNAAGANGRGRTYDDPIPVVEFETAEGPLELRIGFSFVDAEGARRNLEAEVGTKSFDEVQAEGDAAWNELLGRIHVEGGTDEQRRTFYSTLYRSMLWPALRSDVDGRHTSPRGEIVKTDYMYYTEPSFWDDYRNKLILIGMLRPEVTCDVISSCIEMGHANGYLPTFFHGDHASVFVAGNYLRGLRDFDVKAAYELMLRSATVPGPGRPYLQEYMDRGWISELELQNVEIHTDAKASVTKTQEYSYDDYAVALLARELGDTASYRRMMARTTNYRNLYDPETKFMRGRLADGRWVADFDPCFPYYHYMYREATAWMSAFFAPHDTPGMIELYGGPEVFEERLDSLFTIPWKGYEAHNLTGFIGQYCHGNQPDHTFPFLYSFIGKPAKSQRIIDRILNEYYNMGENGLAYAGMDDAGEMSSWYVLSAIGLYTYSPADPEYLVTVPLFDRVTFKLGERPFTIRREGTGREMTGFSVDGKPVEGLFVNHDDLAQGKTLVIETR